MAEALWRGRRRMAIKVQYTELVRLVGPELALLFILDEWLQQVDRRLSAIEEWSKPYDDGHGPG